MRKNIEESLKKVAAQGLSQESKNAFEDLKNAARCYLDEIAEAKRKFDMQMMKENIKEKITSVYAAMRGSSSFTQQMVLATHVFEEKLNKFLNRKIYLTYVTDQGELLFYDEENVKSIYSLANKQYGRGNISSSVIKNLIPTKDALEETVQEAINNSVKNKYQVYLEAVKRWEEPKNGRRFYWIPNKKRVYTRVIPTKGDIAEGYVEAVVNDGDISYLEMESSLKNLYNNYIERNTLGAIVKGDVVYKDDGSIQFAVKEGSFSTARIGQYINFAKNIQKIKFLTPEDLLTNEKDFNSLSKISKKADKIIETLNEKAEEALKQTFDKPKK